jgi:hypothetical protein
MGGKEEKRGGGRGGEGEEAVGDENKEKEASEEGK